MFQKRFREIFDFQLKVRFFLKEFSALFQKIWKFTWKLTQNSLWALKNLWALKFGGIYGCNGRTFNEKCENFACCILQRYFCRVFPFCKGSSIVSQLKSPLLRLRKSFISFSSTAASRSWKKYKKRPRIQCKSLDSLRMKSKKGKSSQKEKKKKNQLFGNCDKFLMEPICCFKVKLGN